MRCKNGSAVGDNYVGESMKSDDVGDEEFGEVRSIESLGTGNEVTHFGHSIDEHEDRVLAARSRQVRDEVASEALPGSRGDGERSEFSIPEMTRNLGLLTQETRVDVVLNESVDTRKPIVSGDQLEGSGDTAVASERCIMVLT